MSEIVPSTPEEGRITIRSVSRSPRTTVVLLVAVVALVLLWAFADGVRRGEFAALQRELDNLKQENEDLIRKNNELESDLRDTRDTLSSVQEELRSTQESLGQAREEVTRLREQLAAAEVVIDQLKSDLVEAEVQRDIAVAERDEARKALEGLTKDLEDLNTRIGELVVELKAKEELLDDLAKELDKARKALKECISPSECARLKEELADSAATLVDAQAKLDSANAKLEQLRNTLETVTGERDQAREDLANSENRLEETQRKLEEALKQLAGAHSVQILEGELQVQSFPSPSFYLAEGTTQLEAGEWSLIVGDIGGQKATPAGGATITFVVHPSSCERELEGEWPGALALDCPAVIKWTVESRYPHFLLNILPIENLVMQENIEQSTEGE